MDISISEAAKMVGRSPVTNRSLVNSGKVRGVKKGRAYYVDANAIRDYYSKRSHSDSRALGGATAIDEEAKETAMMSAYRAQIRALEDERDYLRKLLDQEKEEKSELMKQLLQRTAEIKAFLEGKSGLFRFFK